MSHRSKSFWRVKKVWEIVMDVIKKGRIIETMVTHFSCSIGRMKLNVINFMCLRYNHGKELARRWRLNQYGANLLW